MSKKKQKEKRNGTKEKLVTGIRPLSNVANELFCQLYAGVGTKHFFSNGQNSYIYAYGKQEELHNIETTLLLEDNPNVRKEKSQRKKSIELVARVQASVLLTNPNIQARVNHLLSRFIDDKVADRELAKVIVQDYDLKSKVDAIKEFNRAKEKIKGGGVDSHIEFSWKGQEKAASKK